MNAPIKNGVTSRIPNFATRQEEADFWDSHDFTDYLDELEQVSDGPTRPVDLRLSSDFFRAIERVAAQEGVPYQLLMQRWLREKLSQVAPELLPHHA